LILKFLALLDLGISEFVGVNPEFLNYCFLGIEKMRIFELLAVSSNFLKINNCDSF